MEVVLPISVDGSFGFCPRASSDENPLTFASEFLAFRHQDKARSSLSCDSSSVYALYLP